MFLQLASVLWTCFSFTSCYLFLLWVTPIQYSSMEEKWMIECTWTQLRLIGLSGMVKYDSLELQKLAFWGLNLQIFTQMINYIDASQGTGICSFIHLNQDTYYKSFSTEFCGRNLSQRCYFVQVSPIFTWEKNPHT